MPMNLITVHPPVLVFLTGKAGTGKSNLNYRYILANIPRRNT